MGNNGSTVDVRAGRFALNMRFVAAQLFRVTAPGCVACIHVQQLLAYKVQHGFMGRRDFRGAMIDVFGAAGFNFVGEFAVCKNPQALRNGTGVLSPTGYVPIETLSVGDKVIGSDGKPTEVTGVFPQGARQLYRVRFSDGASIDCDGEHLWAVETAGKGDTGKLSVRRTEDLCRNGLYTPKGFPRYYVPIMSGPAQTTSEELPIHPYALGTLLGDGSIAARSRACLTCEREIVTSSALPPGPRWKEIPGTERGGGVATYAALGPRRKKNELLESLRALNLHGLRSWEKYVPAEYLLAKPADRLEVVRGLMDTDGTVRRVSGTVARFVSTSKRLAEDLIYLVESLGGVARLWSEVGGTYVYRGERRTGRRKWRVSVRMPHGVNPFRYSRKAGKWLPTRKKPRRAVTSIEPVDTALCTCISVEAPDNLYVTERFVVTHNSIANRQNLHCLQFKTGYARSGTMMAPAPNDYVLIFGKPGEVEHPVRFLKHAKKNPNGWCTTDEWVRDAHGIWTDILEIDILDGARLRSNKESEQERHVCCLQIEVIRRLVRIYSNPTSVQPDVLVMDPFMGIGSTAWVCLGAPSPVTKLSTVEGVRNVVGFELKESYHRVALANEAKARRAAKRRKEDKGLLDLAVAK